MTDGALYIRAGKADAMIVGGAEAVQQPIFHACFEAMRVLAPAGDPPSRTMKPFDLNRAGFVPGEGGAALLIEGLDHAQARGATIYAEVVGTGSGNDGHDMAAPDPSARGLLNAMGQALDEAAIPYSDVGYVNTHGTGTKLGDRVDVGAVRKIFGEHAHRVLVSSIKAATGHMMAASSALEVIVAAKAAGDRHHSAHAQLRDARPRLRPGLRAELAPRGGSARRDVDLRGAGRAQRRRPAPPLGGLTPCPPPPPTPTPATPTPAGS